MKGTRPPGMEGQLEKGALGPPPSTSGVTQSKSQLFSSSQQSTSSSSNGPSSSTTPSTKSTSNGPAASGSSGAPDYKDKYRNLKSKLMDLVTEGDAYEQELRRVQQDLVQVYRDRNFLLDRLIVHEPESETSHKPVINMKELNRNGLVVCDEDSDATLSSDSGPDEYDLAIEEEEPIKRKRYALHHH